MPSVSIDELRRCRACETVFEADVADPGPDGPRCPQCGLTDSAHATELGEREVVIRKTTPFR